MTDIFICEDETPALNSIKGIIENYCADANICGIAQTVNDALKNLPATNPDLVLMDVNYPDGTAFDILNRIEFRNFKLIFITAYEEYAIKAIKLSASDYLLKPLNPKELLAAVQKVKDEIKMAGISNVEPKTLLANSQIKEGRKKKIVLKTQEHIHVIEISDIIRCESDSSYTTFFLRDKNKIMVSRNLKEYEELLSEYGFLRTHKSHLVNSDSISMFDKTMGYLILKDQSKVPVSVRKKDFVLNSFDKLMK